MTPPIPYVWQWSSAQPRNLADSADDPLDDFECPSLGRLMRWRDFEDRILTISMTCIFGLVIVVIGATPVFAQSEPSPGADDSEKGQPTGDETLMEERSEVDRQCPATAGGSPPPRRLILLGVRCFKVTKYARAYAYYRRAREKTSTPFLTAALGRSLHELGLYHAARRKYEAFLETGGSDDSSKAKIERRLEQLERTIAERGAEVRFSSFPSNARVYIELQDDHWAEIGRTPFTGILEAGEHRIAFEKPRYRRQLRTVRLAPGRSTEDTSDGPPQTVRAHLVSEQSSLDTSALGWKRAGWITGLSSLAVLGGAGALFGVTRDKFDEARDYVRAADYVPSTQNRLVEEAHRYQRGAYVLTAVGGAGLIAGISLYVRGVTLQKRANESTTDSTNSASPSTSARQPGVELSPVLNPGHLGIRVNW